MKRVPVETSPGDPAESAQSFEATLDRLGAIVERLETGDLGLEESLRLFEEGVGLARRAQARLDAAEKRVEELLEVDAQGKPRVRELEIDSG